MQGWFPLVFVVATHKIHRRLLVSSFRRTVENHERADQLLPTPGIARIGVKDGVAAVFVERT